MNAASTPRLLLLATLLAGLAATALAPAALAQTPAEPAATPTATPDAAAAATDAHGSPAVATPGPDTPPAQVVPTDDQLHDGLRALKAHMEKALNERDLDALLARCDEHVVFTTMNGDVVNGKGGIRAYFTKMMEGPDKVVDSIQAKFEPAALSLLYGGDTAIAWGVTDDHYKLANGQDFNVQARWSSAMVLRDGQWYVANFHYSTNMFDNPVLSAQRRYLLLGCGLAALIVGLIGFALGRRGRRAA